MISLLKASNIFNYINIIFFTLFIIFTASIIYLYPGEIIYDQGFICYIFSFTNYPYFESGIVSNLIVGLYNKFISCSPDKLNSHIKILAMIIYCTSAYILGKKAIKNQLLFLIYILFIFFSRYPLLWLSSELFAGALLFLTVYSISSNWNTLLISLQLVLLGFTKPDLIFLSLILLLYCFFLFNNRRKRIILITGYTLFLFLLLLPGIITKGFEYFCASGRSFCSFGQHYAVLFQKHQLISPTPNPWENWNQYMNTIFPGVNSIKDIIMMFRDKYYDFVALSIVRSIIHVKIIFNWLLIFIPIIFTYYIYRILILKKFEMPNRIEQLILFTLFGFMPFFLFSFTHMRYLARYYPLFIIFILIFIEKLFCDKKSIINRIFLALNMLILCISLMNNFYIYANEISNIKNINVYWFPD